MAPVRRSLEDIAHAVGQARPFDPRTTTRSFTFVMSDYAGFVLLPTLLARIRTEAPGIDVRVRPLGRDAEGLLHAGAADVVISAASGGPSLLTKRLFEDRYVCVVRDGHTMMSRKLSPEEFASLSHVLIAPLDGRGPVHEALAALGLTRRVAVKLPHFMLAPFVLTTSDLVLTVAERIGQAFAELLPLRVVATPLSLPRIGMSLLWHERNHHDSAHAWMRQTIAEVSGATTSGEIRRRGRT
jgi:DNA-binding transcriptional LysR family regulator